MISRNWIARAIGGTGRVQAFSGIWLEMGKVVVARYPLETI